MTLSFDAALQDRPIEREADDALDRMPFVDSLVRALVRDERAEDGTLLARRSRGYVVGLTGEWGLGKSSVLNLLNTKLGSMDRVTVALFNPWLFSGRDELLRGFFSALRDAMGRSKAEQAKDTVAALDRYWGAIDLFAHTTTAIIDGHGGSGVATATWRKWKTPVREAIKKPALASPQEERRELEKKLKASNTAVVVLIDELDRVEDEDVRAVAQLVKAIGDIKGISYLVAYDPKRVTQALGNGDVNRGSAYLEKIIQYPIPLRPLFGSDIELLLQAAVASNDVSLAAADFEHEKVIIRELIRLIDTPRDIKRLVGAFAILEPAIRGEICPYDVLGYAWIATKAPNIRAKIADDLDAVADDPSEDTMIQRLSRRMNKTNPQTLSEALGEDVGELEPLLKILFPTFATSHANESDHTNRIGRRRNLIRLLYLGNPPDMVPRNEIERIWTLSSETEMAAALLDLKKEGRLRAFLDRADDLLPSLKSEQDTLFWPALAQLLTRTSDWISGPDELRAIAEDATASLVRLGARDRRQTHRLAPIMDALIATGDLVLVPSVLRKQMFANGLTRHSSSERAGGALNKTETESYVERELPRYRAAVVDGTALRRLPNCEAIFAIANREEWDSDLRSAFTQQLQGPEALSTLAALLVPPGYGVDKSTLDELSDADVIGERLSRLATSGEWPQDDYRDGCLRRLRAATRGQSFFDNESDDDGAGHAAAG